MFSWLQKRIAIELLSGPKSIEELSKILGEPALEIEKELKKMKELKLVVEKHGLFSLSAKIEREFHRRKELREEQKPKVEIVAYIEITGVTKQIVQETLKKLSKMLKEDKSLVIFSMDKSKPRKEAQHYYAFIELNIGFKDFASMLRFVNLYAPSTIEVIRPPKAEFTAYEIQEGLNQLAEFVFSYKHVLTKYLSKVELADFYRKLLEGSEK